jgi:SAM-dependent methyltransferase
MTARIRSIWQALLDVAKRPSESCADDLRIVVERRAQRFVLRPNEFESFDFRDGDQLTIVPPRLAAKLTTTPDGSKHIRIGDERAIRVPPQYKIADVKGFKFPAHLVVLTGAGPETLEPIGAAHISNYRKFMDLTPEMTVLEIGCGIGRDAMQLIEYMSPDARYIGIDVTRDSIEWCRRNIAKRYPNFEFHHFDAKHELYNPLGSKTSLDFRLPAETGLIDRVFLGSVFTHLFETEVLHYMKEIRRVLAPDGQAYATFFLYAPEIIAAAVRTDRTPFGLHFKHPHGDGCYVSDPQYPTGSVAYTDDAMQRMIREADLRLARPYLRGWWSGYYEEADDGQDVAILTPATYLPRA